MLGSKDDVLQTLEEIEERDPSVSYDRTIYRRTYAPVAGRDPQPDGPYSPLTDLQIEQLVGKDGPAVRIVCGLDLLGLDKVGIALRRIAESGLLPGTPKELPQVTVVQAGSVKELREAVSTTPPAQALKLVVFAPENGRDAELAIAMLERQKPVLDGVIRPILLLEAADAKLREVAIRRSHTPEEGVWLATWGSEMLRIHLHNIEKTDLDTKVRRAEILRSRLAAFRPRRSTWCAPSSSPRTRRRRSRAGKLRCMRWPRSPPARSGRHSGSSMSRRNRDDYRALYDLISESLGIDLVTIGPDLLAMGLISGWNHSARRIRRSALGDLIVKRIETDGGDLVSMGMT